MKLTYSSIIKMFKQVSIINQQYQVPVSKKFHVLPCSIHL